MTLTPVQHTSRIMSGATLMETTVVQALHERPELTHFTEDGWATAVSLGKVEDFAWDFTKGDRKGIDAALLLNGDDFILRLYRDNGPTSWMTVNIWAKGAKVAAEVMEVLRSKVPEHKFTSEERQEVGINFWSYGQRGPRRIPRAVVVPSWAEIADNYPEGVRETLDRVTAWSPWPENGGQLMLWHGPPGTGKTYALRALAWEWRKWANVNYIVDPETFFGARADYMLDVILATDAEAVEEAEFPYPPDEPGLKTQAEPKRPKWQLLVLEDAGELFAADAKERTGQGLSRLLNTVDGLIGQGLQVCVLATTNEELQKLHPAVERPGRCSERIEFPVLTPEQARAWLAEHGADETTIDDAALADLYARVEKRERDLLGSKPSKVGFGS